MEEFCIFCSIVLFLSIVFGKSDDENKSLEEQMFDDEQQLDVNYRDRYYNSKEPEFYHPVTGYKGTKSEMDTYIINRERKLSNHHNNNN